MTAVRVSVEPTRLLAAVRRQATPSTIGSLIRTSGVWDLMRARNIGNTGHNFVVYHDVPGRDLMHSAGGIPVDIGAEILEPFESDAELACTTTPAGRVVSALHVGDYSTLGVGYEAIHSYCRREGLNFAGPYWEYYGHWSDDPAKLETTIYYALAE